MSFSFTGLIADHIIKPSPLWVSPCRFVEFTAPFAGTLIQTTARLNEDVGKSLAATALALTKQNPHDGFLALEYHTWGGAIDSCTGFVIRGGAFGTTRQGEDDKAEDVFTALFMDLGKPLSDGYFAPFAGIERS